MKQTIELHKRWKADPSKGEVFTPSELVREMLDKIPTSVWENPESLFLDPCMGTGTFLIEILKRLINIYGYSKEDAVSRVYGYDTLVKYVNRAKRRGLVNVFHKDFLNEEINMKFDVVVGNPPYQEKVGERKTEPIWNKFVIKSFELVKDNGYVSLIHPTGWRSSKGKFKNIQELLLSNKVLTLSMNDFDAGSKIFGVGTNFDYYVIQKSNETVKTEVNDINNKKTYINLKNMEFIPNGMFDEFLDLIAGEFDEKVNVLYSRSAYGTDKENMSKEFTPDMIYPCVYTITKRDGVNLFYSNTNQNGHFGVSKLIWSNGLGTYPIIDNDGEYGLTQFSYGIIDTPENLIRIKSAMESENFLKLMSYVKYTNNKYDYKIIATFKKDFWKKFIDE
jgi:hypothetical protein